MFVRLHGGESLCFAIQPIRSSYRVAVDQKLAANITQI